MVKIAKPNQDMRFDVPVIGVKTIEVMRAAGARAWRSTRGNVCCWTEMPILQAADSAGKYSSLPNKPMTEAARIADQLRSAFEGEAWHGPAVLELLADVDPSTAACASASRRAQHLGTRSAYRGLGRGCQPAHCDGQGPHLNDAENFPPVKDKSRAAWKEAIALLKRAHNELVKTVAALPDSRLNERVPGKKYTVYVMLHGVTQHELYHAGQIAILKKTRL